MGTASFRKVRNGVPNFFGSLPNLGGDLANSIITSFNVGFRGRVNGVNEFARRRIVRREIGRTIRKRVF